MRIKIKYFDSARSIIDSAADLYSVSPRSGRDVGATPTEPTENIMLRLCKCGHKKSSHRYIYYGKIKDGRSPCKECNIEENMGACRLHYTRCNFYKPLTNLEFLEQKYNERNSI